MGWASSLTLSVTIDGSEVGDTLLSASFGAGRPDWFDTLSPSTATFVFDGDASPAIGLPVFSIIGAAVVASLDGTTLWAGRVDTFAQEESITGHITTTVTATDIVGQLGQMRLEDEAIGSGDIGQQIVEVGAISGSLVINVDETPSGRNGATLAAIGTLDGSLLDWIASAEADANTLIVPNGQSIGELTVTIIDRGRFGDYGDRVASGYYTSAPSSLWRMDEASGNIADSIGGITGTAVGTPTYHLGGPWGSGGPFSIGFQKADAADEFTFGDNYDLTGTNFTIAGWIYCDRSGASSHVILSKTSGTNGYQLLVTTAGTLSFTALNASSTVITLTSSAGAIAQNTWYHVAVVKSGTAGALFIDGEQVDLDTFTSAIGNSATALTMGGPSSWFGGGLTMMSIWSATGLSATVLRSLAFLGRRVLTGSLAPFAWSETTSVTTVINHWIFRQPTVTSYTDSGSITAYGDHTFELETPSGSTSLSTTYSSGNRSTLDTPRTLASASFHIASSAHTSLATLSPLDIVERDGVAWQVMSVQHDITPGEWDVTVELAGTVADLTGAGSALPA